MKTKTEYIYEIQTLDTGKIDIHSKRAAEDVVIYMKSFLSHDEAEEHIRSLKMKSAYDMHYLRVYSRFHHITITPI